MKVGDIRNFTKDSDGNTLTILRINYGSQYPSWSQVFLINPDSQDCVGQQGNGLASIYSYFKANGTYLGKDSIKINLNRI